MDSDYLLILRGLGIAVLGTAGVACYILGLTALYLGSGLAGIIYLISAAVLIGLFHYILSPYLDILEARGNDVETEESDPA